MHERAPSYEDFFTQMAWRAAEVLPILQVPALKWAFVPGCKKGWHGWLHTDLAAHRGGYLSNTTFGSQFFGKFFGILPKHVDVLVLNRPSASEVLADSWSLAHLHPFISIVALTISIGSNNNVSSSRPLPTNYLALMTCSSSSSTDES